MNRKQRRAMGIKQRMPTMNVNRDQFSADLQKMKDEATEISFILSLCIPVMVMHDKYSLLMKKEVNGKSRTERFFDLCMAYYEEFHEGRVTVKDFVDTLEEETGSKFINKALDLRGEKWNPGKLSGRKL